MAAAADYRQVENGTAKILKITGTSSYPTGGYDLPADWDGSSKVINRPNAALGINDGATNIALVAGSKVKFIVSATGAEVANATNVAANAVQVLIP